MPYLYPILSKFVRVAARIYINTSQIIILLQGTNIFRNVPTIEYIAVNLIDNRYLRKGSYMFL